MMKWQPKEKKRAVRLLAYQVILWVFVDVFLIRDWISTLIPSSVVWSCLMVILGELFLTAISIYTDIRFSRYLNRRTGSSTD